MKPPEKYVDARDGELVPVTLHAKKLTRIACCDCALVHTQRIVLRTDARGRMRGYIQFWRDEKETRRHRKNRRIRVRNGR